MAHATDYLAAVCCRAIDACRASNPAMQAREAEAAIVALSALIKAIGQGEATPIDCADLAKRITSYAAYLTKSDPRQMGLL